MSQSSPWARAGVVATLLVSVFLLAAGVADAATLDRYLERQMRKARVPGLAIAIVVDDEVALAKGYGWADPVARVPATPDTVFAIASISKPFTATTTMRLVESGLLDLDADVNGYLAFAVRNPAFPDVPITLRQLITHSSSISDRGFYARLGQFRTVGDWPGSLGQFLIDYLTPGGLYYDSATSFRDVEPGTDARYSNVGVALVGGVIESVTGGSFAAVSHNLLLEPLGMAETSWFLAELDLANVAVPCGWTGEAFEPYPHLGLAAYPSGSLRTSVLQLARFMRLHLNEGRLEGQRLLRRKTARQMVRVQWSAPDADLGLGFWLSEDKGRRVADHGGGAEGIATSMWLLLDEGIGVAMLTNGEPEASGRPAVRAFFRIGKRLIKEGRRISSRGD